MEIGLGAITLSVPDHTPPMKKLINNLLKVRLVVNLFSIWFQIWTQERLLDSLERDIRMTERFIDDLVRHLKELGSEKLNFQVELKLATLKENARVNRETLEVHRRQFARVRKELAA